MTSSELLNIRLYNQLLAGHQLKEPAAIVSWMGAMQSQALDMAKWAIGARLEDKTVRDIEAALNSGEIIRTHILRPTWHFVTAEDFHWMRELSNPQLIPAYYSYFKMLGIEKEHIYSTFSVLERILEGDQHLTKQQIGVALQAQKIEAQGNLLTLIIQIAEIEGIVCNGRLKGKDQTFTLLSEWVPRKETICREEAVERMARRYFTSHGPATVHDFVWWSGLRITECRRAVEAIRHDFVVERTDKREFLMPGNTRGPEIDRNSALLLSQFDEMVVSYKDRSDMIGDEHYGKVMTKNGLFSPTVMLNGKIVGSWRKTTVKGAPRVEMSFFEKTPKKIEALFKPEIKRVEKFYSDGRSGRDK